MAVRDYLRGDAEREAEQEIWVPGTAPGRRTMTSRIQPAAANMAATGSDAEFSAGLSAGVEPVSQGWEGPEAAADLARETGRLNGPGGEFISVHRAPGALVGTNHDFFVDGPPSAGTMEAEWFCVNDMTQAPPGTPQVVRGPRTPQWEGATFEFPGEHYIVCKVTYGSRSFSLAWVKRVAEPDHALEEAVVSTRPIEIEDLQSAMVLQEAHITQGAMDFSGESIQSTAPNPATPRRAPNYELATYTLRDPHRRTRSTRWFVRPSSMRNMARDNFQGHERIPGQNAYSLGGGPVRRGRGEGTQAIFTIAGRNTYNIVCEELDRRGNVIRTSTYMQSVISSQEAAQVGAFREYQERVGVLAGQIQDPQYVRAVYMNKESGVPVQLNLYVGPSKENGTPTLLDLTPGVGRREYETSSQAEPRDEWAALVNEFNDYNSYPEGRIYMDRPGLGGFWLNTDGSSTWSEWCATTGWVSLGLAVLGTAATLTGVGAPLGIPLLVAAGATGAASASFSMAENLSHDQVDNLQLSIDAVSVVTSLMSGGLAARAGERVIRGVRYALYLDTAGIGIEATLIAVQYADTVDQIINSDIPPDEKRAELLRLTSALVVRGTILALPLRSNARELADSGTPGARTAGRADADDAAGTSSSSSAGRRTQPESTSTARSSDDAATTTRAPEETPGGPRERDSQPAVDPQTRLEGIRRSGTFIQRRQVLAESQGSMGTHEAYTVGAMPPAIKPYLDDSANWISERAALHAQLLTRAQRNIRLFADSVDQGTQPTIFAMRGNTAAGKTRAIRGNIPELEGPVGATQNLRHRDVNPDNFKSDLIEAESIPVTHAQVHAESSSLARRLEASVRDVRRSDGSAGSILIDKRLDELGDVEHYAQMAQDTGRRFNVYDIDASFETSLAGVLGRQPGGESPIPPFSVIAEGFDGSRGNRRGVIQMFMDNPELGKYELYGSRQSGDKYIVAEVNNGTLTVHDRDAFADITTPPAEAIDAIRNTRITEELIETITENKPAGYAADLRNSLQPHVGRTWEEAITEHMNAAQ